MPDYDKSDSDTVVLTLPGTVIDENYSLLLLENSDIDLTTTVLLDKVQKGKPITDDAIKLLRKKGLIEGRKPHLYVSRQVAKVTNKQIEYTLKKGFNDAECQEWILKALVREMLFVFFICNGFKVNKVVGPSAEGLLRNNSGTFVRAVPFSFFYSSSLGCVHKSAHRGTGVVCAGVHFRVCAYILHFFIFLFFICHAATDNHNYL